MSHVDPELLADFLTEAGELVDRLGEQIMAFESAGDDAELLNALFRTFHTLKGSAGFLDIAPMVTLCHAAEELMGGVRSGEVAVTPEVVDGISGAATWLEDAIAALLEGETPTEADAALIATLRAPMQDEPTAAPADATAESRPAGDDTAANAATVDVDAILAGDDDTPISDDDFEALLAAFHGPSATAGTQASAGASADADPESGDSASDKASDKVSDQSGDTASDKAETNAPAPTAPTPSASTPADKLADKATDKPAAKPAATPPRTDATIRVDTQRLDCVVNQVGELVLVRNRLSRLREQCDDPLIGAALGHLDQVTTTLQGSVMRMRMQPVGKAFAKVPRTVRDLARSLNKQVEVVMRGEDTELDRTLAQALSEPLVHLVRNAVDHGIESPEDRRAAGKSATGTLTLTARQVGDHIHIEIIDDGGGIDPSVIRAKAIDKGVIDRESAASLDSRECLDLIFHPGFSTRDAVSAVSGRGVGMDVVRSTIGALNGHVEVDSTVGQGSTFLIRLPLTLAILPALMVQVCGRDFAIPVTAIDEVARYEPDRIEHLGNHRVLRRDETLIAVHDLADWIGESSTAEERHAIIVDIGRERRVLIVDTVPGREEIVVKPLGKLLASLSGLSGASVTGDGHIALVVDLSGLLGVFGRSTVT